MGSKTFWTFLFIVNCVSTALHLAVHQVWWALFTAILAIWCGLEIEAAFRRN